MVQIVWTDEAIADMSMIYNYIEQRGSKFYAIRTLRKIRNHVKQLKVNKSIGRIVPEFNNQFIRELIKGNYRIVYRIKKDKLIEILTVWHSARDLSNFQVNLFK